MAEKKRLDCLLFEQGLAQSREKARAMIMAGNVYVDNQKSDKPGTMLPLTAKIEVRGAALPYVSRGGLKLEKAMEQFPISLENKVCMDIGASTGGFTDCMLQNGARKVYAIDVGYGQLAWKLRTDARVVNLERTNVRYLTDEQVPEPVDFFQCGRFLHLPVPGVACGTEILGGWRAGGMPDQTPVRGRARQGGEEGRGARAFYPCGSGGKDRTFCPGKRLFGGRFDLLSGERAGGEYRIPGVPLQIRADPQRPSGYSGAGGGVAQGVKWW